MTGAQPASAQAAARSAAPRAAGLVRLATSVTRLPSLSVSHTWRELGRVRRFRRMRRCVIASADATRQAAEKGGNRVVAVLATLTYRDDAQFSSRDVSGYIRRVREFMRRRGLPCSYQWVIELTQRGRPHYHVLFWLPRGFKLPKPDESGQWERGSSRIEAAFKPVGYLVKYATKGTGGELPKGARLFGTGTADAHVAHVTHRKGVPIWLDAAAEPSERLVRVVGGWVEKGSGVLHHTPFVVFVTRDAWGCVEVVTLDKRSMQ